MALLLSLNLHPFGLAGQGHPVTVRGVQMGMEVRITGHGDSAAVLHAAARALEGIDSLEWILSDWRQGSELSRLGRAPAGTWVPVSVELFHVLAVALEVAEATDGAFDPTVGALTALWREARATGKPTDERALREARQRTGWRLVTLDTARRAVRLQRSPMRFDFGGVAKGWILGEARNVMQRHGIAAVLIEAGGDIVAGDPPPGRAGWHVAVTLPSGDSVVTLANAALATSGAGAQALADGRGVVRSHVIDTRSGLGRVGQPTITVIGRDPAITDALATALTLVEPEQRARLAERFWVTVVASTVAPRRRRRVPPPR